MAFDYDPYLPFSAAVKGAIETNGFLEMKERWVPMYHGGLTPADIDPRLLPYELFETAMIDAYPWIGIHSQEAFGNDDKGQPALCTILSRGVDDLGYEYFNIRINFARFVELDGNHPVESLQAFLKLLKMLEGLHRETGELQWLVQLTNNGNVGKLAFRSDIPADLYDDIQKFIEESPIMQDWIQRIGRRLNTLGPHSWLSLPATTVMGEIWVRERLPNTATESFSL